MKYYRLTWNIFNLPEIFDLGNWNIFNNPEIFSAPLQPRWTSQPVRRFTTSSRRTLASSGSGRETWSPSNIKWTRTGETCVKHSHWSRSNKILCSDWFKSNVSTPAFFCHKESLNSFLLCLPTYHSEFGPRVLHSARIDGLISKMGKYFQVWGNLPRQDGILPHQLCSSAGSPSLSEETKILSRPIKLKKCICQNMLWLAPFSLVIENTSNFPL